VDLLFDQNVPGAILALFTRGYSLILLRGCGRIMAKTTGKHQLRVLYAA
jgi:hypothetical protein